MGRPPFSPTADQRHLVERLTSRGAALDEVAEVLAALVPSGRPLDPKTLRKHFSRELSRGRAHAARRLKQKAFDLAAGGDRTMLIFLLKTQHGYSETTRFEQTGKDGAPVPAASFSGPVFYLADEPPPQPVPAKLAIQQSAPTVEQSRPTVEALASQARPSCPPEPPPPSAFGRVATDGPFIQPRSDPRTWSR